MKSEKMVAELADMKKRLANKGLTMTLLVRHVADKLDHLAE
jgi:hypothetical protein